jgi:hypothetical protein
VPNRKTPRKVGCLVSVWPGTIVTRQYKGRLLQAKVLRDGFEFEGEVYKSLSAVAKAATGTHWNGYHFFGLRKPGGAK